jgi:hypothetical protein
MYIQTTSRVGCCQRRQPPHLNLLHRLSLFKLSCFGIASLIQIRGGSLANSQLLKLFVYMCFERQTLKNLSLYPTYPAYLVIFVLSESR